MCWWRVLMESDSWWPSGTCQYSAIHNAYHTSLHSDTFCPVRIQMCSVHQAQWDLPETTSQLGLSLDTTDTCIVHTAHKQGLRTMRNNNSDPSATSGRCSTDKEEKQQKCSDATASGKEQPRQRGSIDKLDYTSRFVRVIPTFSQHCHKTVT